MMGRPKTRWIFLLSMILVLTAFYVVRGRDAQSASNWVGTQTCINCHNTWLDNNPATEDVASGAVSLDYPPLNLASSRTGDPWYSIPEGWTASIHNVPASDLQATDEVACEACHGSGQAHFGMGSIPTPIPNIKTCQGCHKPPFFEIAEFLKTSHANPNNKPRRFFDQPSFGVTQAKERISTVPGAETVPLFKVGTFDPLGGPVSRNDRIEECSMCHQYALQYPQFRKKIAQGNLPRKPEVSCGACHDAHIVAPSGIDPAIVTSTVAITVLTGTSTIVSVAAVPGRSVSYINNKPYKLADSGAQDTINGTWTRGSATNRPLTTLIKGTCRVVSIDGNCSLITLDCDPCAGGGGFLKNQVKPGDAIFISGVASTTVNLPADAKLAGKPITLQATLDRDGFQVIQVIDDKTILVDPPIKRGTNVTYVLADGKKTSTLSVDVSFCGVPVNFEVRDMYTNTEDLCMSCHAKGSYKYTKWGEKKDGTLVDLSPTHNTNIGGQYKTSGHADKLAAPWEEFTAFGGHQLNYPYDMSITGSGGVGSLRNKGNKTYTLTSTPDNTLAYLQGVQGVIDQPTTTGSFNCLQCHNGLTTIDYLNDVQGTSAASVVWGDTTLVCITCHDPHKDQGDGKGPNLRVPVKLSYNTTYFADPVKNPRGGINKFLDGTDIPSEVGTSIICLFCHQGRESGYTVYTNLKNRGADYYTDPNKVATSTFNFQNPHYLDGGAILWSKNGFELLTVIGAPVPNKYTSGNKSHQGENCTGCHMGEASPNDFEGGHTWRPRIETCQECHSTATTFFDIKASADYNGNGIVETPLGELGTINPDSGLFGQLKAALQSKGIYYNPDSNPYFFSDSAFTSNFNKWTPTLLSAAFNLGYSYKAGTAAYVHNSKYLAQLLIDSLKNLQAPTKPWARPAGDRSATDYRTIVINP